jgi:hypothetical protein
MTIAAELDIPDLDAMERINALYVGSLVPLSDHPATETLAIVDSEGVTYVAEPVEETATQAAHNGRFGRFCFLRVIGQNTDASGQPIIDYPFGKHEPVEIAVDFEPDKVLGGNLLNLSSEDETVRNGGRVVFLPARPSHLPKRAPRTLVTHTVQEMVVVS